MQANPSDSSDGPSGDLAIAWAAGLFEGEGCFNSHRRVTKWQVQLQLRMTDKDVVDRFAAVIGVGKVRGPIVDPRPQCKDTWEWHLHRAADIRLVIALLLPYLGERRSAKAIECDAIAATIVPHGERTHCPKGHPLSGENLRLEPIFRKGREYQARRCITCRRIQIRDCMRRRKAARNAADLVAD